MFDGFGGWIHHRQTRSGWIDHRQRRAWPDTPPAWFHGDIAAGNLLVVGGRLSAVIDFGTSGVGDPACDLVTAWTMFDDESREAFWAAVDQADDMWARARGWALWKALLFRDDATLQAVLSCSF